ncbi:replication endonuclease [Halomonas elongata]|uniref:replication endonuclease n=1 Tax=Halomonas elongata TaxID=2746 RepID=UPI00255B014D|nr:replication endonuclease [Halomonas elongata]MDL4862273.1 replication endonuclease [Halomonas elongata]
MTALEQSRQFGTAECVTWRGRIFEALPTLAEDLASGFIYIAKRHGNAAGNTWLRRNTRDLVDPGHIYRRFAPIAGDLERGAASLQRLEPTTIQGIQSACRWLASVEQRLTVGGLNAGHDDDALVSYAEAQARAAEDERQKLIGSISDYNRRRRFGLLPPAPPEITPQGEMLSQQVRDYQEHLARSRNALSPMMPCVPLLAVFRWHYRPPMSLRVANHMALKAARRRAAAHGIEAPARRLDESVQLAKLTCSQWWRRKLRRTAGRRLEQVQREAHRVHKRAGIYCSDMTVERRRSQKVRNRALLETLEAINQDGQVYTLAELAELGLANPDHRRAELMLRIRDTEAEARRLGHTGMFYTITAPSRFHPVLSRNARRNRKYDGSTPREAQQYLQALWAKARAKLAREGLGVYGIRVVEPHHDGTPHWHLLLWMQPGSEPRVTEILREYAEAESPEELLDRWGHKSTARFKPVRIDYSRGTAAGYVAKYISKNINGEQFARDGVEGDHQDRYEHDLSESAPRIEAWAATWGIRQFQFLGLPSVTVWREVRRLTEQQEEQLRQWEEATRPTPQAAARFTEIRQAANAGQWDQFLRLMGGPNTPRRDQPIKPWRVTRMDTQRDEFSHATGEVDQGLEARGRYGETVSTTWGLVVNDGRGRQAEYLTRLFRWEIRPRHQRAEGQGAGAAGDPWTCVNNCTGVDITPRQPSPEVLAEQVQRFEAWRQSDEVRAIEADAAFEAREVRAAARRLFQPPPPPAQEEYFPPELC